MASKNNFKLNRMDRDGVIIVIYAAVLIFGSVVMSLVTRGVNTAIIGILTIVLEVFFLVPKMDRLYLKILGMEAPGWKAYIPVWNELMVFPIKISTICTVVWIVNLISFLLCFIPGSLLYRIFGFDFVLNFAPYLIIVSLIIFLLNSVLRGIGFNAIRKNVAEMKADVTGITPKVTFFKLLQSLTLYLPIFRILGLMMINNILYSLAEINSYISSDSDVEFQEED